MRAVQMMERKRQALEKKWLEEQQLMKKLQEEGRRARRGDRAASATRALGNSRKSILEGEGAAGPCPCLLPRPKSHHSSI